MRYIATEGTGMNSKSRKEEMTREEMMLIIEKLGRRVAELEKEIGERVNDKKIIPGEV